MVFATITLLDCDCELPAGHLSYALVDTAQDTAFQHVVSHFRGAV